MFRSKRSDTKAGSVEQTYNVELNVREDAKLGNILKKRKFDSQSQLIRAARGQATEISERRRLFLSFHFEDIKQVRGFRLLAHNPKLPIDFYDGSVREPIDSERGEYLRSVIKQKISRCDVLVCLIGAGTAWRDWVEWEIRTAVGLGKGICGVRLKESRGRAPELLVRMGAPVASWDMQEIVSAIERAAAVRS
jgi:hypothetical protein